MDIANKITGPGYYPRRPSRTRPLVVGKPYRVRMLDADDACWDSAYWDQRNIQKPAHFEIDIISAGWTIVKAQVCDDHDEVLYTQVFDKPVNLRELQRQGKPLTCDIDVEWRM